MSSILKALKKLENASETSANDTPFANDDDHGGPHRSLIRERPDLRWVTKPAASLALILVFIWLLYQFSVESEPKVHLQTQETITEPQAIKKKGPDVSLTPYSPVVSHSTEPEMLNAPVKENGRKADRTNKKMEYIPPHETTHQEKVPEAVLEDIAVLSDEESFEHQGNQTETPEEAQSLMEIRDTDETDKYSTTEKITDMSWLRLQAISWTEDSAGRIAVINNKIVKEGHTIEDVRIAHIDQNFIIVQKGAKELKLEFGIK